MSNDDASTRLVSPIPPNDLKRNLVLMRADDVLPDDLLGIREASNALFHRSTSLMALRVLIVEDDIPLGKFLGRELELKLISVDISEDGEAAVTHLQESIYDLVILDLNLPTMDGMTLLKQVHLSSPQIPILVLTARNRTEDLVLALSRGPMIT